MKVFYWGLVQVNQAVISRWQSTCSLWYRDTMSMRLLKGGIHGPLLAGHWGHHYTTCGTCLPLGAVMSVRVDVSGQWHFQGNNPFLVNKHRRISCTIWLTWSLDMSDLRFQGQELVWEMTDNQSEPTAVKWKHIFSLDSNVKRKHTGESNDPRRLPHKKNSPRDRMLSQDGEHREELERGLGLKRRRPHSMCSTRQLRTIWLLL